MTVGLGPGSTFAGYRIESVVGRGGMGVVYRATDLSLERPVALKLIAPELADDAALPRSASSRSRGWPRRWTTRASSRSTRPASTTGSSTWRCATSRAVTCRRCSSARAARARARAGDPRPDRERARRGAPPRPRAPRRQAGERAARRGRARLPDRLRRHQAARRRRRPTTAGSPARSTTSRPEQIRGEPVDGRTDEYALACVLYECLAGTPPFRRQTQAETLWAHLREEPPPLEATGARPGAAARRSRRSRDERYATCAELIEAAREALGSPPRPRGVAAAPSWPPGSSCSPARRPRRVARGASRRGERRRPRRRPATASPRSAAAGQRSRRSSRRAAAPSNIAVGEGAVWVARHARTDDRGAHRSRDARPSRTVHGAGRRRPISPPAPARCGSATGGGEGGNWTTAVSRVDPRTAQITAHGRAAARQRRAAHRSSQRGLPADRRRRRRRVGDRRRHRRPHRPAHGPARGDGHGRRRARSRPAARASGSSARTTPAP